MLEIDYFRSLADEHRIWLAKFHPQYLANWEKCLAPNEESALAEARIRRILQSWQASVEPNEYLAGSRQQPDFRCCAAGCNFYVEVSSISIETAASKAGIEVEGSRWTTSNSLNSAVVAKCKKKAKQCSNLDAPVLLAVATFNARAAMARFNRVFATWLLTGETMLAWDIDYAVGTTSGDAYEYTRLNSAAFLRPDGSDEIELARRSISGVLLCGLGSETPRLIGVLNPGAERAFDAATLPEVPFGSVKIDQGSGQVCVSWTGGDEQ